MCLIPYIFLTSSTIWCCYSLLTLLRISLSLRGKERGKYSSIHVLSCRHKSAKTFTSRHLQCRRVLPGLPPQRRHRLGPADADHLRLALWGGHRQACQQPPRISPGQLSGRVGDRRGLLQCWRVLRAPRCSLAVGVDGRRALRNIPGPVSVAQMMLPCVLFGDVSRSGFVGLLLRARERVQISLSFCTTLFCFSFLSGYSCTCTLADFIYRARCEDGTAKQQFPLFIRVDADFLRDLAA